jgi:nucleotide-binding universal stress UspA family protein
MKLDRILIAVDFTPDSTSAATWVAKQLAPRASLLLVHVVDRPDASALRGERETDVATRRETECIGAQARLEEMAEWLEREDVHVLVRAGNPPEVLLDTARDWFADLLVVGRHGTRPGIWDTLGSTVDHLLGHSGIPVLVASGTCAAPPSHVLVAAEHGIDASVAGCVQTLYDRFRPRITVFHSVSVAVPTYLLAVPTSEGSADGGLTFDRLRSETDQWTDALVHAGIPRSTLESEIALGEPASEILAAADRIHADLIVVDRPHEGGLRRALFGSITRDVIRHAKHPVLVVQHSREAYPSPIRAESLAM